MIRIPICFGCKNFDNASQSCPAYPDGVPGEVLADNERMKKKCGKDICYEEGRKILE